MLSQTSNPIGGHGIGVVQPQSGLDYPFVAPNLGFNSELLSDVRNLFADFYISYDDPGYYGATPLAENPLRIYWLAGFGSAAAWSKGAAPNPAIVVPASPPHGADLIVVDSTDRVVFDTSTADVFNSYDWGGQYKIYEWIKTTKPGEKICRAVVFSSVHPNIPLPEIPTQFCPRNAVLDERTINKIPKRVLAMRVQNGACVTPWFKNRVTFVNGYNTTISLGDTETENLRRQTAVTFAAAAGSGRGKYGDCPDGDCPEDAPTNVCPPGDDPVIEICEPENGEKIISFNGSGGNLLLSGKDCIWARYEPAYVGDVPQNYMTDPETGEPQRAAMGIGADCKPCCDCEDYLETAKYTKRVADRYAAIGRRVTAAKAGHEDNIRRWSEQRRCRLKNQLKVLLFPQSCSDLKCIEVVPIFCNQCVDCARDTVLTLQMDFSGGKPLNLIDVKAVSNPPTDSLSPCCGSSTVQVNGAWPTYQIFMPSSDKGETSAAKLRFCVCVEANEDVAGVVTATLTGNTSGDAIRDDCGGEGAPITAIAQKSFTC